MANVLKCSVCNIVIDELTVIDEDTLTRICLSAFSIEEIKKSKSLLFESLSSDQRKILRKGKGKEERDLNDIVSLFKTVDPEEIPVFVARQLEKLPPITFDHLDCTKLLKDILRLQAEINSVKAGYATVQQLNTVKQEILHEMRCTSLVEPPASNLQNINCRRGAWTLDSGPMGLSHFQNSTINEQNTIADDNISQNQYRDILMNNPPASKQKVVPATSQTVSDWMPTGTSSSSHFERSPDTAGVATASGDGGGVNHSETHWRTAAVVLPSNGERSPESTVLDTRSENLNNCGPVRTGDCRSREGSPIATAITKPRTGPAVVTESRVQSHSDIVNKQQEEWQTVTKQAMPMSRIISSRRQQKRFQYLSQMCIKRRLR